MNTNDLIKIKLSNIESLLSYNIDSKILPVQSTTQNNGIRTIIANLGEYLSLEDANLIPSNLYSKINELYSLFVQYEKICNAYHNSKEHDLEGLKNTLNEIEMYKKFLKTTISEIATLNLFFKNTEIISSEAKNIIEDGITLPVQSKTLLRPNSLKLRIDSFLRTGTKEDSLINSDLSSITNSNKNDLYSIYSPNSSTLSFAIEFHYEIPTIVNEIEVYVQKKKGQSFSYSVVDGDKDKIVFQSNLAKGIFLPILSKKIVIEFLVQGEETFDISEISFFSTKYKNSFTLTSIKLPSLSNHLLSLEKTTLKNEIGENIFSIEGNISNKKLFPFREEKGLAGPYVDPNIQVEIKIDDTLQLKSLLNENNIEPTLALTTANSELGIINVFYKNKGKEIASSSQTTWPSIPLPYPYINKEIDIKINNKSIDTYTNDAQYNLSVAPGGYALSGPTVEQGAIMEYSLPGLPSVFKDTSEQIVVPFLAPGSTVKYKVATDLKEELIPVNFNSSLSVFLKEHVQELSFIGTNIDPLVYTKKKHYISSLGAGEWSISYKEGILKVDSAFKDYNISYVKIKYLDTKTFEQKCQSLDGSFYPGKDINIFQVKQTLTPDVISSSSLYYSLDKNRSRNSIYKDRKLTYPKGICLCKGGISIPGYKEVPFINGKQEFITQTRIEEIFDLSGTLGNIITLIPRFNSFENINIDEAELETYPPLQNRKLTELPSEEGDYMLTDSLLRIYTTDPSSYGIVSVSAWENFSEKLFSIDYQTNTLYLSSLNSPAEVYTSYVLIDFLEYELAETIPFSENLNEKQYYLKYISDNDLSSYYSPIFVSLNVGLI